MNPNRMMVTNVMIEQSRFREDAVNERKARREARKHGRNQGRSLLTRLRRR